MTDEEAQHTVEQSENLAKMIVMMAVKYSKPDTAIVAIGLAAGFIFANLEYEDGIDMDEMFNDWLAAVKAQCEETKKQIEAAKKEAN